MDSVVVVLLALGPFIILFGLFKLWQYFRTPPQARKEPGNKKFKPLTKHEQKLAKGTADEYPQTPEDLITWFSAKRGDNFLNEDERRALRHLYLQGKMKGMEIERGKD
jgi:hypothetical protein